MITTIDLVALAQQIQDKSPNHAAWLRYLAAAVQEKKQ